MPIDCGSQCTICDVPIRLDTYKGCSHDCKYCFVQKKTDISDIKADNCMQQLVNFIQGKRTQVTSWCDWNIPLHWGGMSDPFQPCERRFRVSYKALQVFAQTGYPFIVSTKGKIIAEPEYLELLDKCNAVVQFSAVCSKYDRIEKGAPTFEERMQVARKVAPHCKRLIIRVQPYMTEVFADVMKNIPLFKEIGAYGITVEGMKFAKVKQGLAKVGDDFCYPVSLLEKHFQKLKEECHRNGLAFFSSENRLRKMGDSLTCCGCAGLEGFRVNTFNMNHFVNGDLTKPTKAMQVVGSSACFKAIDQNAGSGDFFRQNSFAQIMCSERIYSVYSDILTPTDTQIFRTKEEKHRFTMWLRSTGAKTNQINEITGTKMGVHYLCPSFEGQTEIPTPEHFEKIVAFYKMSNIPDYIIELVYGEAQGIKKKKQEHKKLFGINDESS